MTITTAFPDFDVATLPAIPAGWTDISYRNDTCPSFDTGTGFHVFIDYANVDDREIPGKRFVVVLNDDTADHPECVCESDDWNDVLTATERAR